MAEGEHTSGEELRLLALRVLKGGSEFTDLLVASGERAVVRRSPLDWEALDDEQGLPAIVPHGRIVEFLSQLFLAAELGAKGSPARTDERDIHAASRRWKQQLHERGSLHAAVTLSHVMTDGTYVGGRFRCTVVKQSMGEAIGLCLRPIKDVPKDVACLGLPLQVSSMVRVAQRGLILVTGPTGMGKSTTLAGMINEINESKCANIVTLEDPVEFIHERKKSIINQRELGLDVESYDAGVKDALRFAPDVIMVGEIRDAETALAVVNAAVSGHLVLASTHACTTAGAIRRMASWLKNETDLANLAACLVGVIAQALVRDARERGKNHLGFEFLHCRDPKMALQVAAAVGDSTGQKIAAFENAVRDGSFESEVQPLMRSLRALVSAGKVDPVAAAAVVPHPEDKEELAKMKTAPAPSSSRDWAGKTASIQSGERK
jgi:Tfp pilus assembly pilus retraction ATPase PilT